MTNNHPITPPPELVRQWASENDFDERNWTYEQFIATKAARWGANQQLNADCEWLTDQCLHLDGSYLRAAMRPKSPSLRKQAYDALDTYIYGEPDPKDKERTYNTIRKALEALDD